MALLNIEQLTKRLTKLENHVQKHFDAHVEKINSLEVETIAALRIQLQALAKRVHDLEKLQKAKAP
jgi:hypothetical protein